MLRKGKQDVKDDAHQHAELRTVQSVYARTHANLYTSPAAQMYTVGGFRLALAHFTPSLWGVPGTIPSWLKSQVSLTLNPIGSVLVLKSPSLHSICLRVVNYRTTEP